MMVGQQWMDGCWTRRHGRPDIWAAMILRVWISGDLRRFIFLYKYQDLKAERDL
jgi:hypothetical protein